MTYGNHTPRVRSQSRSDWRRLDLSFLGASADINFYPLYRTAGTKYVRIQVKTQTIAEYNIRTIN